MQSLLFFNKEGDNLNFKWREDLERWEGDLLFHQNSNDTFKTIGIYLFEQVQAFEYEAPGVMALEKFQLFNEFRFNISGCSWATQSVVGIEPANNDETFYSKWIVGEDFESKFPIGTQIVFNSPIFEFTNRNQAYTVVDTKKGRVLVISNTNNRAFNNQYGAVWGLTQSYQGVSITGINAFGVYNYVDSSLQNTLSSWSEPDFYTKYFNGKKLNLVNTQYNDGTWTINNIDLLDKVYYKYNLPLANLGTQSLKLEIIMKTDLPKIYDGAVELIGSQINFDLGAPKVLRPGSEFTVSRSFLNSFTLRVAPIDSFLGNANLIYYTLGTLVTWENNIYQCIQAHTWSATSSITPANTDFWFTPNYLPLTSTVNYEVLGQTEIFLTTNRFAYLQEFTQSSVVTLASAAERFKADFNFFNLDLYYQDNALTAELIYPTLYSEVNFIPYTQSTNIGTVSAGNRSTVYEQNVQIEETMIPEVNRDTNENFVYNIVFTDLDEYGFIITIDGQVYQEEIEFVYNGTLVNMERTIDLTLRNWLVRHYSRLLSLGLLVNLQFVGDYTNTPYFNSIRLRTEYPNVPVQFDVKVGTTADFYIQHSEVIFYRMSNYFQMTINGRPYAQTVSVTGGVADITGALRDWVDTHANELADFGIYVSNINSMLVFKVKTQTQRLDYIINVGLPLIIPSDGLNDPYKVINRIKGNFGALAASNEVILYSTATYSFENEPFATGQVMSINNSVRPLVNREYNILYLGPDTLVLSYEGPFWGTTDPYCDVSPYVSIAFSNGFGATGCVAVIPPPIILNAGQFNAQQFSTAFNINFASINNYNINNYSLNSSSIVDIIHLPITNCMYVLGDNITVVDAITAQSLTTIGLTANSPGGSIKFKYNPISDYLYCLSDTHLFIVDPITNQLAHTILLGNQPDDVEVNPVNGDVYVSFAAGTNRVEIWYVGNFTNTPSTTISTSGRTQKMVFHIDEQDIYITQDDGVLTRIIGSLRTVDTNYSITGLNPEIFYEPIDSSIYVFDSNSLINLDNGTTQSIPSIGNSSFKDLIYNYSTGDIFISQNVAFSRLNLSEVLVDSVVVANYGYLAQSNYDNDIYIASQNSNQVFVWDSVNNCFKYTESVPGIVAKLIYNPDRQSMFGIIPSNNTLIEIGVTLGIEAELAGPTYSVDYDGQYGTLAEEYIPHPDLWLAVREYIRKPRINYNDEPFVKYVWKWETDEYPQMFLFDFSGNQLPTGGSYAYTGPRPLTTISLNKNPNKVLDRVNLPEFQQTIFSEIVNTLVHIDSEDDVTFEPEPLETFIGFRADDEGPMNSKLLLIERNEINFNITPTSTISDIVRFRVATGTSSNYGILSLDVNSSSVFTQDSNGTPRGLKIGQLLKLTVTDVSNTKNKYFSMNSGITVKIREIYTRLLVVDFIDIQFKDEYTKVDNYPTIGSTTYLRTNFKIVDKVIGRFTVYGQTEIEDIRFKIELSNTGHNVNPEDIYIFKEYDIYEQGIDWVYMNRKRKEMLAVRHEIFPYVGSYKAIINAINYFGYNDLELYEYYRNINTLSQDYKKLFKVEIPDIFDNTVEGWTVNDFISHTLPNPNYEGTNLFNLTYKITDKEGTNVLLYSLNEVIIKLQGLKYWLQNKVIPITHRILDITGRADFVGGTSIIHKHYDAKILNIRQELTPIDFKLSEAYLMPVNSGSTVYTCHIDFFTPNSTVLPDNFTLKIRTYKTYKEWNPFTTYQIGDQVTYYSQVYESVLANNRIRNPRKFQNVPSWSISFDYLLGQTVVYNNYIYEWIGTQSSFTTYGTTSNLTPGFDIMEFGNATHWNDLTEWKRLDYEPVQTIVEYRTATHSFNFTVDSNIDPFVAIEVTSDNGYGQIYTMKKNYEIRGLNDLYTQYEGDPIEPFSPIVEITTPLPTLPEVL